MFFPEDDDSDLVDAADEICRELTLTPPKMYILGPAMADSGLLPLDVRSGVSVSESHLLNSTLPSDQDELPSFLILVDEDDASCANPSGPTSTRSSSTLTDFHDWNSIDGSSVSLHEGHQSWKTNSEWFDAEDGGFAEERFTPPPKDTVLSGKEDLQTVDLATQSKSSSKDSHYAKPTTPADRSKELPQLPPSSGTAPARKWPLRVIKLKTMVVERMRSLSDASTRSPPPPYSPKLPSPLSPETTLSLSPLGSNSSDLPTLTYINDQTHGRISRNHDRGSDKLCTDNTCPLHLVLVALDQAQRDPAIWQKHSLPPANTPPSPQSTSTRANKWRIFSALRVTRFLRRERTNAN